MRNQYTHSGHETLHQRGYLLAVGARVVEELRALVAQEHRRPLRFGVVVVGARAGRRGDVERPVGGVEVQRGRLAARGEEIEHLLRRADVRRASSREQHHLVEEGEDGRARLADGGWGMVDGGWGEP